MRLFAILLSGVAGIVSLAAQAPPTPAATPMNMLGNPSFDTGFRRDDLWDGVDSSGSLAGERGALPVLTTSGTIAETAMPVSVSVADMNGDQLPDIGMMDPVGYFRIFFNEGTKTEPKFGVGELSTIFLSRIDPADPTLQGVPSDKKHARMGQRIHLTDMTRSNRKDLVIGNYLGEIMLLLNGSGVKPDFKQPANIAQVIIPTMKDSLKKWGNVFAPATWDWNRDGKDDLLVGEGSYSANSIHLLLNQGSGVKPVFDENNRSVLAYGMGLEQLTPCVVDYNGDGALDLLVTERTGKVAVYLNSGKPWKPGEQLPFDSFIPVGGAKPGAAPAAKDPLTAATAPGLLTVGGIATIAAADMNGDGLFDLVFGKSNGKVAMSLNTGSKTEPKFATPTEVKGTAGTPPFNTPSGWECDFGIDRGNFYGFFSVVKKEDDPNAQTGDGKPCLKAGYRPSPNKFMPVPTQFTPGFKSWKPGSGKDATKILGAPANYFELKQGGARPLENNQTYVFTMKVKGQKVTDAAVEITLHATKELSTAKLERGTRGSVKKTENKADEKISQIIRFNPGPAWTDVRGEFSVKFADKELSSDPLDGKGTKDEPHGSLSWATSIVFALAPGSGELYFDDCKITKKQ
jgi:hypothetical protein